MDKLAAGLTPLGVMVLGLLREGDMHPYEMIRLMRQRHDDRMLTITNGTVYNTVRRLERGGLLREVGVERDGNRPERTTYTLTDLGGRAVGAWVRRELSRIDRPADFRVALAESHNLDRAETLDLLRLRRDALADDEVLYRDGRRQAAERAVPDQFLIEVDRQSVLLAAELGWLDDLIGRLERNEIPWGPATVAAPAPAPAPAPDEQNA